MAKAPTLDEHAERNRRSTGYPSYIDRLPETVRDDLMRSKVGHAAATRWLHDLGHTEATQQMVGNWRRKHGWRP
jgi:hypothetical protein